MLLKVKRLIICKDVKVHSIQSYFTLAVTVQQMARNSNLVWSCSLINQLNDCVMKALKLKWNQLTWIQDESDGDDATGRFSCWFPSHNTLWEVAWPNKSLQQLQGCVIWAMYVSACQCVYVHSTCTKETPFRLFSQHQLVEVEIDMM